MGAYGRLHSLPPREMPRNLPHRGVEIGVRIEIPRLFAPVGLERFEPPVRRALAGWAIGCRGQGAPSPSRRAAGSRLFADEFRFASQSVRHRDLRKFFLDRP